MKKFVTAMKKKVAIYVARGETGATMAEYGLLLALIAVICIEAISLLGSRISAIFSSLWTSI
jgi:pilus assembly protein Flp/PilA